MAMQVVCMRDDLEEKLEAKNELLAAMDVKKKDIEKATRVIRAALDKSHDARQDLYNVLRQPQQQLQESHAADHFLRAMKTHLVPPATPEEKAAAVPQHKRWKK